MPWNEESIVEQRLKFVLCVKQDGVSMAEGCREFNISRPTGYKWLERYDTDGIEGLEDRSCAPDTIPHKTSQELEDIICAVRKDYEWGAPKIRGWLAHNFPDWDWPSSTTVGRILQRNDLLEQEENRRRKVPPHEGPLAEADEPNQIWSVDFKGQFELQNGEICYPLTIYDNYSRMLLGCWSLPSTKGARVRQCMEMTFEQWGLPERLRSDNGTPFSSRAPGGLSRVSAWWHRLGITHERIDVGEPQQNGRLERFHLTLKRKCSRPPEASLRAQQKAFDQFRTFYNQIRPHGSLDETPPVEHHQRSDKDLDDPPDQLQYPRCDVSRRVNENGCITFGNKQRYLSEALGNQSVGLVEVEVDVWLVRFATRDVGLFEVDDSSISPIDKPGTVKRATI